MILVVHRNQHELAEDVRSRMWLDEPHLVYDQRTATMRNLATGAVRRFVVADELLIDKVRGQVFEAVEGLENVPPSMLDMVLSRVRKEAQK